MPKINSDYGRTNSEAFQQALDELDVIGRWEWDAVTDVAKSDVFVALLFNIDPDEATSGVPLAYFVAAIHPDDRDRVLSLIRDNAEHGSTYLTEYRVISVDGRTRWVLARGRFISDGYGRPASGSGILVDITQMRMNEGTFADPAISLSPETPLDRAADHLLTAHAAIMELQDTTLKTHAEVLLLEVGRRLAQREVKERLRRMN